MKLLARMLSFLIEHISIMDENTDRMTKEEYDAYMRIKAEFDKVPKEKLAEIKKELDSMSGDE